MRMTTQDSNAAFDRRLARTCAVALLAGTLIAGCGMGKDDEPVVRTGKKSAAASEEGTASPPATVADKQSRLAQAVVDGKTTAPVHMQYDVLSKPVLGQPFEVELAFELRLPADTLDIEVTEAPGLVLVGEKTARFAPAEVGRPYSTRILVKGDQPGLFYIGVVAKLSTQVQTESKAFALPVVIGEAAAGQKPAPAQDASGQAVQSLPAQEPQ